MGEFGRFDGFEGQFGKCPFGSGGSSGIGAAAQAGVCALALGGGHLGQRDGATGLTGCVGGAENRRVGVKQVEEPEGELLFRDGGRHCLLLFFAI